MFKNVQDWCCMAVWKETSTGLEHRDVACATAKGKILGQKGKKLNPKKACISCSCTGDRSAGRERAFRNTYRLYQTTPYHTGTYPTLPDITVLCLKNIRIWSISTEKLGNTRITSAFVCLTGAQDKIKQKAFLPVLAAEVQTVTTVPACRGDGLTNCSTVIRAPKQLPSSLPHHHKEWAIFNADHLNLVLSTASQRLQTSPSREQ